MHQEIAALKHTIKTMETTQAQASVDAQHKLQNLQQQFREELQQANVKAQADTSSHHKAQAQAEIDKLNAVQGAQQQAQLSVAQLRSELATAQAEMAQQRQTIATMDTAGTALQNELKASNARERSASKQREKSDQWQDHLDLQKERAALQAEKQRLQDRDREREQQYRERMDRLTGDDSTAAKELKVMQQYLQEKDKEFDGHLADLQKEKETNITLRDELRRAIAKFTSSQTEANRTAKTNELKLQSQITDIQGELAVARKQVVQQQDQIQETEIKLQQARSQSQRPAEVAKPTFVEFRIASPERGTAAAASSEQPSPGEGDFQECQEEAPRCSPTDESWPDCAWCKEPYPRARSIAHRFCSIPCQQSMEQHVEQEVKAQTSLEATVAKALEQFASKYNLTAEDDAAAAKALAEIDTLDDPATAENPPKAGVSKDKEPKAKKDKKRKDRSTSDTDRDSDSEDEKPYKSPETITVPDGLTAKNVDSWTSGAIKDIAVQSKRARKAFQWLQCIYHAKELSDLDSHGKFEDIDLTIGKDALKRCPAEMKRRIELINLERERSTPPKLWLGGCHIIWLMRKDKQRAQHEILAEVREKLLDLSMSQDCNNSLKLFMHKHDRRVMDVPVDEMANVLPMLTPRFRENLKLDLEYNEWFKLFLHECKKEKKEPTYQEMHAHATEWLEDQRKEKATRDAMHIPARAGGKAMIGQGPKGYCNKWLKGDCPRTSKCDPQTECPYKHPRELKGSAKRANSAPPGTGGGQQKQKGKGKGKPEGWQPSSGAGRGGGKGSKGTGRGGQWAQGSQAKGKAKGKGKAAGKGTPTDRKSRTGQPLDSNSQPMRGRSPSGRRESAPACKYYYQGKCTKGDQCDMWHPSVCNSFFKGGCTLGQNCRFLHHDPKSGKGTPAKAPPPAKAPGPATNQQPPKAKATAKAKEQPKNKKEKKNKKDKKDKKDKKAKAKGKAHVGVDADFECELEPGSEDSDSSSEEADDEEPQGFGLSAQGGYETADFHDDPYYYYYPIEADGYTQWAHDQEGYYHRSLDGGLTWELQLE